MKYNDRWTPPPHWPSMFRYPSYYSDRRLSSLCFLILATIILALSIIALIIVFAVEHSWFHDNFEGVTSVTRYGLWRVCFNDSSACDSWFATSGPLSIRIDQRLNISRAGINAWQALEIIFLFLTAATFIIAVASLVCYGIRNSLHYYLAVLAAFCVWLAASIGICTLFVFGFGVFNVSPTPRELDWCFYLNLVAVILAILAAILLSIYDSLLKKPNKMINDDDDAVVETFADLNGNPAALSPSTFVVVRRNRNKRNKPYSYPQILYPNHYQPSKPIITSNEITRTEYTTNTNQQKLTPYTSIATVQETTTNRQQLSSPLPPPLPPIPKSQTQALTSYRSFDYQPTNLVTSQSVTTLAPTQSYRPTFSAYPYQPRSSPIHWHRTGTNVLNRSIGYASEPAHDYFHGDYYPIRRNFIEQKREPRVLHYYTGYDYFATIDPSDVITTRHYSPDTTLRYSGNPSYQPTNNYLTSTM